MYEIVKMKKYTGFIFHSTFETFVFLVMKYK